MAWNAFHILNEHKAANVVVEINVERPRALKKNIFFFMAN